MKIYKYTCTLQSDLIISSKASTEGQSQSLDYIPGVKFLGIVASEMYNELSSEDVLKLFHNGKVAFGNAYPKVLEDDLVPVPAAFFFPKGKSLCDEVLLPMNLALGKYLDEKGEEVQPKQARGGYFSFSKKIMFIPKQNFRLKSAFDYRKRRSVNGQMFGYFSLPKGLSLHFTIRDSTGKYADLIKDKLEGLKRVGRSKSAEYGLMEIRFEKEISEEESSDALLGKEAVLYALSDLCFVDQYGQYTAIPTSENLTGSPKNEIIWQKSHIRSRKHPVWNGRRQSKDADRIIIEKGSVFVVKINESVSENFFNQGVGVLRAEGFGQIQVNPKFIPLGPDKLECKLSKPTYSQPSCIYPNFAIGSSSLIKALNNRKSVGNRDHQVKSEVNSFVQNNKNVLLEPSKSQWGTIRGYAKQATNFDAFWKMTFEPDLGFIHRGNSENQWRNAGFVLMNKLEQLKKDNGGTFSLDFVQKLSSEMPKLKES